MPTTPNDIEVIQAAVRSALIDVHVALPGIVESYDNETQTCSVLPAVRRGRIKDDRSRVVENLPVIPNVPVQWFQGGGFFMTMPLAKGDEVTLLFNEADPSVFFDTGEAPSSPAELVRHGLGHPIAIPGGGRKAAALSSASATDMVLGKDGDAVVSIEPSGNIRIGASATEKIARADKVSSAISTASDAAITAAGTAVADSGAAAFLAFKNSMGSANISADKGYVK